MRKMRTTKVLLKVAYRIDHEDDAALRNSLPSVATTSWWFKPIRGESSIEVVGEPG